MDSGPEVSSSQVKSYGYLLSSIDQRIQQRPDVLESILFDGEEQRLRGRQLVGYTIAEIKSQIPVQGVRMTKAESLDKAWRLAAKEKDFSLVDE